MTVLAGIAFLNLCLAFLMVAALRFGDRRRRAAGLLMAILLILGLQQAVVLTFLVKHPAVLVLSALALPAAWLMGPLLFVYARLALGMPAEPARELRRYGIPALLHFAIHLGLSLALPVFRDVGQVFAQKGPVGLYSFFVLMPSAIWTLYFLARTNGVLPRFRRDYEQRFAGNALEHTGWLRSLTRIMTAWLLCAPAALIISELFPSLGVFPAVPLMVLPGTAALYVIFHHLINRPNVFRLDESESKAASGEREPTLTLDPKKRADYRRELLALMEEHRPFLREELSMADLADILGIPGHHLSLVVNNDLGMNFYGFVNTYRVREAARLMEDPARRNDTVLNIAYDSGFNSKSSFNRAFKRMTGRTPREYRAAPDPGLLPEPPGGGQLA